MSPTRLRRDFDGFGRHRLTGAADGLAGSELEIRFGVENPGHCPGVQSQRRFLVPLKDCEIGIRAPQLQRKLRLRLGCLGIGQATLSGPQAHECKLVVFAALDLQGAPVGSVRHDGVADIRY
jgi:hypothetical protein